MRASPTNSQVDNTPRIKMTKLGSGIGEADRLDPDNFYSIMPNKRGRGGFTNFIKGADAMRSGAGCFIEDDKQDNRHLDDFKKNEWSPTKKYNRYRTNINSPKS